MPIETKIVDPPPVFLQKVAGMSDAKKLENIHRILHAWMAELTSASPKTLIGNGWTRATVQAAHEAVVRRLKELKPNFDHKSPITAARPTPGMPVMLVPDYISIVGSTLDGKEGADLDVVVRDDKPVNESLDVRIAQLLGGEAHISHNLQGPHDLRSKPLYHLALVPVGMWNSIQGPTTAIKAALGAYRRMLKEVAAVPQLRNRIIIGAGLLREQVREGLPLEMAEERAEAVANLVVSGESMMDLNPSRHITLQASWDPDDLYKEAMKVYRGLLGPVSDYSAYGNGLRKIFEQIEKWKKADSDPFKDKDEALDAARELGAAIAKTE